MADSITPPQLDYIEGLMEKRNLDHLLPTQREFLNNRDNIITLTKMQASKVINELKKCPIIEKPREVEPEENDIPAGRYFVVDPTNNEERFFKVDKPKDGRWKGYTFLKVQASDDFYPIKDKAHREAVLAEIAKDPINAMNEYGIRLGKCGNCGRTLTNIDSRLRGLGPVCAGRIRQLYKLELTLEDIQNIIKNAEDEEDDMPM